MNWLKHFWRWIRYPNIFTKDYHCFISTLGDKEETCLICGKTQEKEDWEQEELDYKELLEDELKEME